MKNTRQQLFLKLLLILAPWMTVSAASLETAIDETVKANESAKRSQERIENLADTTRDLLQEYRVTLEKIESLKIYNNQLEKQLNKQDGTLASISRQSNSVEDVQRNIVPLMLKMLEVLEEFISLDMPFLQDERQERMSVLKTMMDRPDVSLPDKYRRIMEAYQIEIEYGRTIEADTNTIVLNGEPNTVDTLRIGRVALLFRTLDGDKTGYWDKIEEVWKELPNEYNESIAKGLLIARKQSPPDLFKIPVQAPVKIQ